jgi:hypothetical protein
MNLSFLALCLAGICFVVSAVQRRGHYLDLNELIALIGRLHVWSRKKTLPKLGTTETCVYSVVFDFPSIFHIPLYKDCC